MFFRFPYVKKTVCLLFFTWKSLSMCWMLHESVHSVLDVT